MSEVITAAVAALSAKVAGFDGVAKFVIPGEGAIMIDSAGTVKIIDFGATRVVTDRVANAYRTLLRGGMERGDDFLAEMNGAEEIRRLLQVVTGNFP